jgi:hypothetical protein
MDKPKFKRGIYFDNNNENIVSVANECTGIYSIKVNSQTPPPELFWDQEPLKKYLSQEIPSYNSYYQYLMKLKEMKVVNKDTLDISSGLQDKHIIDLAEWADTIDTIYNKTENVAIFDWDRTITLFEGVLFISDDYFQSAQKISDIKQLLIKKYPNNNLESLPILEPEDILLYLLGGVDRLDKIRRLFMACYKNSIAIYIITNHKINHLFKELLDQLFLFMDLDRIDIDRIDTDGNYIGDIDKLNVYTPIPYNLVYSELNSKLNSLRTMSEFSILCHTAAAKGGQNYGGQNYGGQKYKGHKKMQLKKRKTINRKTQKLKKVINKKIINKNTYKIKKSYNKKTYNKKS